MYISVLFLSLFDVVIINLACLHLEMNDYRNLNKKFNWNPALIEIKLIFYTIVLEISENVVGPNNSTLKNLLF